MVFGLGDSGRGKQTISYAAYPGETPVFSSGRTIKGWKKVTGRLRGLPKVAQGRVYEARVSGRFFTLFDKEGLLPRSRSNGFFPLGGSGRDRLRFPKGQLRNWSNVDDVEIVMRPHHAWIVNILPVVSVDEQTGIAHTAIHTTYPMYRLHYLEDTENTWVENVLEELDEPGEWALNTKKGKVYLWPRSQSPVVAPQLLELIRVEGRIDHDGPTDVPARNLCFRGLTFVHGERYQLTEDDAGLQHDWDMYDKDNALLRLRGTENCVIERCHFLHSGSGAIRVDLHGIGNTISGNHIEHMGGGGILLCGYGPGTKDVNRRNCVTNNHIHHVGEIYWHSPGIFVWQSGDTLIAGNLIYKCTSQGIILKLNNRCVNNIIADVIGPPRGYCIALREGPMTGATIKRNILYSSEEGCTFISELNPRGERTEDSRGQAIGRARDGDCDYNIYYCAENPRAGQHVLKKSRSDGIDAHSMAVDPLFVNPESGNFSFQPNSPALKMGIVPFDMSKVGLRQ